MGGGGVGGEGLKYPLIHVFVFVSAHPAVRQMPRGVLLK